MKEQAISFYKQGYNCSQCILKAAEYVYNKPIPKQCYNMCQGVNTGFGVGSVCSVLIAGVMVFGLFFNEQTVTRLRIKLFSDFKCTTGSINCGDLIKTRSGSGRCEAIVGQVAESVDQLIRSEMHR